jgi:hypothetical protein
VSWDGLTEDCRYKDNTEHCSEERFHDSKI